MLYLYDMQKIADTTKEEIARIYVSAECTTEALAERFNVRPRTIQRIAKQAGVIRSAIESNKLMARFKDYSSLRVEKRAGRKTLRPSMRYRLLTEHPWCTLCGARPPGVALQVDHIDGDATNNHMDNLQVLCMTCNYGKK